MPWWKEVQDEDGTYVAVRTYDKGDLVDGWQLKNDLGGVTVSTVFVGTGTRPYYETLVSDPSNLSQSPVGEFRTRRYETRDDAVAGHQECLQAARKRQGRQLVDTFHSIVHVDNEYRALDAEGNTIMVLSPEGAKTAADLIAQRETDEM